MRNRLMLAPLTNQQSHDDGTLSDEEYRWLTMRATGGFGLTMTCAAHVQEVGRGFAGQLGTFDDRHVEGLGRLARGLNAAGTVSYVQLHHAGIRAATAVTGLQAVGASDDAESGARALTTAEVEQVVADFVAAARRAQRAGFHGVEVHGAHGYLVCQFLSPEVNRRSDRYGGSLDNRSRLLFEIVDGIRAECGDALAISVRLSPQRFGMRIDEVIEVYGRLIADGTVDLISMSLGDVEREPEESHHHVPLSQLFADLPRGNVRLGVAGRLYTPTDIQRVLDRGVDIAVLGRAGILHHDYPLRAGADTAWTPRRPPVDRRTLAAEGVSARFVDYLLAGFDDFVAD
jgi:2,4-dienoyl-CoA reductase-like NADH-dependent reductase (Old Yellow Enzyme family)